MASEGRAREGRAREGRAREGRGAGCEDVAEDVTQDAAETCWAPRRMGRHLSAVERSSSHPWPTPNCPPLGDT